MRKLFAGAWFGWFPVAATLAGCAFFSIEDQPARDGMGAGGTGTGGSVGKGGSGGATAGSGTGGGAGSSMGTGGSSGGTNGGSAGSGGSTAGGTSGTGGGAGSAGAASGGTAGATVAGNGGLAGSASGSSGAGGAGAGTAGAGGSGPVTCMTLNPGSEAFDGHCYLFVSNPVTWQNGRDGCEALGAHLVTLSSGDGRTQEQFDAEQAFVWGLTGMRDIWIGATDGKGDMEMGSGDPFTWITGEAMTLDKWADGEPNNYQKDCPNGGTCYEHCGFMWAEQGGNWNDDVCANTKPYVCEWDMGG